MSISRFPQVSITLLPLLAVMSTGAVLSGCGSDRGPDTRVERAVVVRDFAVLEDADGNRYKAKDAVWQRPVIAIDPLVTKGDQTDTTECDLPILSSTTTVLAADIDSTCFVSGKDSEEKTVGYACSVDAGVSRYSSVLGAFEVVFINNSTKKEQHMSIDGIGVNIHIENAAGAEVWNYTQDSLDYQDWLSEASNLLASEGGDACETIAAISDGTSLPTAVARFGTPGRPALYTLSPANSEDMIFNFVWNGKDADGNDVPAGTYTARFEMTVTDTDTGQLWESPEPLTFEIKD